MAWTGMRAGRYVVRASPVSLRRGVWAPVAISPRGRQAVLADLVPGPHAEVLALWTTAPRLRDGRLDPRRRAIFAAWGHYGGRGATRVATPPTGGRRRARRPARNGCAGGTQRNARGGVRSAERHGARGLGNGERRAAHRLRAARRGTAPGQRGRARPGEARAHRGWRVSRSMAGRAGSGAPGRGGLAPTRASTAAPCGSERRWRPGGSRRLAAAGRRRSRSRGCAGAGRVAARRRNPQCRRR
jgi:hypothetical protein